MTNKTFLLISWLSSTTILIIFIIMPLHPIHLVILLLIYNITLCLNMSTWKPTVLFSILFFLIMISGLMIIFLYFSSLISNEKTWTTLNKTPMIVMTLLTYIFYFSWILEVPLTPLPSHLDSAPAPFSSLLPLHSMTTPMFYPPLSPLTLLNMTYLLLVLFLIMKMCTPKIKSMRKLT